MAREMSYAFSLGATLASSFKGAMTSARKQVVGLARDVRTMEKSSTGRLGATFEASKNKIRQLGDELKGAKAQLASFQSRAAASGGATGTLARQIAQAEKRVQTLSGSLRRVSTAHKEHIAAIRTEVGSLGRLRQQYRELSA